jgi:hypothetical protein
MSEKGEYDDRAARAFGSAFERAADRLEPVPIDAASIVLARRRGALVRLGAVAAAVALVAAGTSYGVGQWGGDDASPTDRREATQHLSSSPSPIETAGAELPSPDAGWRWESYRDLAVQVPDDWPYDLSPGSDWCTHTRDGEAAPFPTEPFVDLSTSTNRAVRAIQCDLTRLENDLAAAPPEYWAPHLWFEGAPLRDSRPEIPDGTRKEGGWTRIVRTVGGGRVGVLTDEAHLEIAERIVESARLIDTDHLGCASRSPIQEGRFPPPADRFEVSDLYRIDSMTVCLYDLYARLPAPGLLGSARLEGAEANAVLAVIRDSPVGGGPDTPETCARDEYGDTAIVLRLTEGKRSRFVHVFYDTCFGNGFDDGTTKRRLTEAGCAPLWRGRVVTFTGSSRPFAVCHPPGSTRPWS